MAYNLPPPWDSGYALPDNVRDEGLERRGFVTKWMPRGTYDAPKVGSGGYVLPPNVQAEAYGQGTYTTKWLPRGFVDSGVPPYLNRRPKVVAQTGRGTGARQVTFAAPVMTRPFAAGTAVALSGADLPEPFVTYGARAADVLLRAVTGLPQHEAKKRLKQIMDTVDPTLWTRTAELTRRFMEQGMRGQAALRAGLASAMSSGIAAEIVRTGLSRSAPQARSLLGLGCYGCAAALGATPQFQVATAVMQASATQPVYCKGYSWNGTRWSITRVGQTDQPAPPGTACPVGVDHTYGTAPSSGGGAPADFTAQKPVTSRTILEVGPFKLPATAKAVAIKTTLTPAQETFLKDELLKAVRTKWVGNGETILAGRVPFVKFRFPKSDSPNSEKLFGLFYNASAKSITWKEYVPDTGILGALWNAMVEVATAIYDAVGDALEAVGELACDLLSNKGIAAASAGAATLGGAPPQAGVAGAQIAQAACSQPPPPQQYVAPPSEGSALLPVAIVGGAALVAVLLSKKKKV